MDKSLRFLSDKLLAFEDSGDILGTEISYLQKRDNFGCDEQIKVVIKYPTDARSIDKVRAYDKIISLLSKMYGQVFEDKNYIIVSKSEYFPDEHIDYAKIKEIFKEFFEYIKKENFSSKRKQNEVLQLYEDKFYHYFLNLNEFIELCVDFKKELNITFN